MRLYHTTTRANAEAILQRGFEDRTGNYLTRNLYTGVWFADMPLDVNDFGGSTEDTMLTIDLDLPDEEIAQYEWVEEPRLARYREFLIPAAIANQRGRIVEVEWDTLGPLTEEDWEKAWAEMARAAEQGGQG
jgi:hypothetical protein